MSDTPNFEQKEYKDHKAQVQLVNDVYNGVDTAKIHIAKFAREDTTDYTTRRDSATLDNFVFSSTQTIKNIIFRKSISKNISNGELDTWLDKIDFQKNINEFSKQVLTNRVRDGFTFIFVDAPVVNREEIQNIAQQNEANIRPYFVNYLRKDVLNWKMDQFGNYTMVSMRETYTELVGKFGSEIKEQIKVFYNDGTVETWREDKLYSTAQREVTQITLIKVGDDITPQLYDMTKINIVQFNRNSELDNYVRVGGAPFPIIYGSLQGGDAETPKTLSINQGLHFTDKQEAGFEWGEMSGANAGMIQSRIDKLNEQMLNIAISFATKNDTQTKTATQSNNEKTEDESKLTDYATELDEAINNAIQLMALFKENSNYENQTVEVNKDFNANILTPEQANSYRLDYAQGIISLERLWELYEKGEYIPITTAKEKEKEKSLLNDSNLGE